MSAPVTIHDVARAAGVSISTVSNAVSGHGRIAPATRERVAEIARELGWSANPTPRGLRRRTVGAIGVLLPSHTVGLEYSMDLTMGAAVEALEHALALTLVPSPAPGGRVPALHVDGVIVCNPALGDPMLARITAAGLPVVTVERDLTPGVAHAGRVESDHAGGMTRLLDHLVAQGAQRIVVLPPGSETSFGHDVRAGHHAWCRATGHPLLVRDVSLATAPAEVGAGVRAALDVDRADAIVSVPDGAGAATLTAVLQAGRRVPEEVLVASYVDSSTVRGLPVPLTAVDVSPRQMGGRAARLLAALLDGTATYGVVEEVPTRLVVRASTQR